MLLLGLILSACIIFGCLALRLFWHHIQLSIACDTSQYVPFSPVYSSLLHNLAYNFRHFLAEHGLHGPVPGRVLRRSELTKYIVYGHTLFFENHRGSKAPEMYFAFHCFCSNRTEAHIPHLEIFACPCSKPLGGSPIFEVLSAHFTQMVLQTPPDALFYTAFIHGQTLHAFCRDHPGRVPKHLAEFHQKAAINAPQMQLKDAIYPTTVLQTGLDLV